jgi:hypothetical protein
MESPEFPHLYTLAALAMTFVGFSVIVMVLRQSFRSQINTFRYLASTCLHGVWVDDIRRLIGTAVAHALGIVAVNGMACV